jgi:hypothetical protein
MKRSREPVKTAFLADPKLDNAILKKTLEALKDPRVLSELPELSPQEGRIEGREYTDPIPTPLSMSVDLYKKAVNHTLIE